MRRGRVALRCGSPRAPGRGWTGTDQACRGMAVIRAKTATMSLTQGQVLGNRSRRRLAPRVMRGWHVQQPVPQRLGFAGGEPLG